MFSSKKKRSRTPTDDPSESNRSFVKNVKSRVSRLVPSRISKWFSSTTPNSTGNGSATTADFTDSSDDEPELMPPTKRKRYNAQESQYNQRFQVETTPFHAESSDIQNNHNVLYTSIQAPPGRNSFIREAKYGSTPYISDVEEPNAEKVSLETSGTDTTDRDTMDRDTTYKSPPIASSSGQSVATKRKSLFNNTPKIKDDEKITKSSEKPISLSSDAKPRFRSSLYSSPFYPGPTMYGGASASTYINNSNIKHQKVIKVRESNTTCSELSSSTRKIMDLLDNFHSPLIEAKRISVIQHQKQPLELNCMSPSASKSNSYKTQELHVPSIASVLRLKHRASLIGNSKAARQIIASHSSTNPAFRPYTTDNTKSDSSKINEKEGTTKLKMRLTRANRGEDPETMPEPVQLPTAVLHIDKNNLPKFSITSPSSNMGVVGMPLTQSVFTSNYKPQVISETKPAPGFFASKLVNTPPRTWSDSSMFKFASPAASPVPMSQDVQMIDTTKPGRDKLNVNEPNAKEKTSQSNTFITNKVESPLVTSTPLPTLSLKGWECSDCWVNNKNDVEKCVACGGKRPVVGDKCKEGHHVKAEEQWKCDNCWIKNESSMQKCAACGGSKPGGKEPSAIIPVNELKGNKQSQNVEEQWKCDTCWIMNKSSIKKCAACGGSKPGVKEPAEAALQPESYSPFYKPPDRKLKEDKWKCSICLVRNDIDKSMCQCCETEREGPSKEITAKPFKFPKESNINLKFGFDPKEQEKNIAKMAEQGARPGLTIVEQTETNNNNNYIVKISPKDADYKKPDNKNYGCNKFDDKADCVVPEGPKTFTFGIQKTAAEKQSPLAVVPSADKPKEEPKIASETTGITSGFLASPKSQQDTTAKPFSSFMSSLTPMASAERQQSTVANAGASLANKNIPNNEVKDTNTAFRFADLNTEKSKPFSFGGDTMPSKSSLGAPSTAPTTAFSFGASLQNAATTAVPSMSFFSNPQSAVATSSQHIFSGNELTTGPALTAPTAAPLFSLNSEGAPSTIAFSFGNATNTDNKASPFASANNNDNKASPFTSANNNDNKASPFASANNNENKASAFGSANNNENKASAFGSANNNDNKASPFGSGFQSGATSSAVSMSTATTLLNSTFSSMSGVDELESGPSTSGFSSSAQQTAWGGKGDAPFAFGGMSNQFTASGAGTGASAPTLFASQPVASTQNVFGISGAGSVGGGGLFGSASQPAQPATMFGAQSTPAVFGAQSQPSGFGASTPAQPSAFGASAPVQPPTFGAPAQTQSSAFGASTQNQQSAFGASAPSQPPAFGAPSQSQPPTFGSPSQSQPSTFGAPSQSQPPSFGAPSQSQPPTFGAPSQSQPPTFGAPSQSQPSTFGAPSQSQPSTFGAPSQIQPSTFGAPSQSQPPAFGTLSQSQPTFGVPTQSQQSTFGAPASSQPAGFGLPVQSAAAPAPAFNFGSGVFNFGQQLQPPQQPQPANLYNFGGGMNMGGGMMAQPMDGGMGGGGGGVQFNMGSVPANSVAAGRRMRRAVRRNPPR